MKRHIIKPRDDWQKIVESQGFTFHSGGLRPNDDTIFGTYWNEGVAYEFTSSEVDRLEEATNELHGLCLQAVDRVVNDLALMTKLGIPENYHELVSHTWNENHPTFYGRFDLAYDGNEIKMLEYNADTPTTLIESALVQWHWVQDLHPDKDQFNSIHERMISRWNDLAPSIGRSPVYFASDHESKEEYHTTEYIRDTAAQASLYTKPIAMVDIGLGDRMFVDLDENPIEYLFKLYPWEWMAREEFGQHLPDLAYGKMGFLEPAWKMILSNKGILPILWEMFPNHENLLEARWGDAPLTSEDLKNEWVMKPMLGREGANITWLKDGSHIVENGGAYTGQRIHQRAAKLGCIDGNYSVIGSWVIGDESAGILVREDTTPVIVGDSAVVPHFFT